MGARSLFGTVICTILALVTSSVAALGQNDPTADLLLAGSGEDSRPSFSDTTANPSQDAYGDLGSDQPSSWPRWTVSADCLVLERLGNANQTLVARTPLVSPLDPPGYNTPGVEALNSNAFQQGFSAGPRVSLMGHGDRDHNYDLEFSYFQIGGWNSNVPIGPDNPIDWLVMKSPGDFVQTNQPPLLATQSMVWDYATQLQNAEFNVRWKPSPGLTTLAGFRWVNLRESLMGALEPPTISWEPPFWYTTTNNNLYGLQIGADGKLFDWGRFSIDGLVKTGIYDNNADEITAVSVVHKQVRSASASTNHGAFAGEAGLLCEYQLAKGLLLKAGYEVMLLEGVALAPGQIQETYVIITPKTVQALGINCNSSAFYHGATVGLEYSF